MHDTNHPAEPSYFVKNLVGYLLPHFSTYEHDPVGLRNDVLITLASTGARTRLELLHAGLTIAFGFAALETLADARQSEDLTPALSVRYRTCATALNRACQQNANILAARLACDAPGTQPATASPSAEPHNDLSDQEADQILGLAKATMNTHRNRLAQPDRRPPPRSRNNPLSHLFAAPA